MDDVIYIVIIAVIAIAVIVALIYNFIKIKKMPKEEKTELLKTYLKGLISYAEQEFGSGHGEEKFKEVENYFSEKAPLVYKLILKFLGKDSLEDLIEDSLKEIKDSFSK